MGVELMNSPYLPELFELSTRVLEKIFHDHQLLSPNHQRRVTQKRKKKNHPHLLLAGKKRQQEL